MATRWVENEGAELHFDVEGSGPTLLMISAGGGEGARFAEVAARLKGEYSVVRYDRRCCSRSTGDRERPFDLAQQARDAAAVIAAVGPGPAYVFGNGAGANIALKLAEIMPRTIAALVAHEPTVPAILEDGEAWVAFHHGVWAAYEIEGVDAAVKLFGQSLRGVTAEDLFLIAAIQDGFDPRNMDFFLSKELRAFADYTPDLDLIRANGVCLIVSAGAASGEAFYARTAQVIADRTGCAYRAMSGAHIAFITDPATFAAELGNILAETAAQPQLCRAV